MTQCTPIILILLFTGIFLFSESPVYAQAVLPIEQGSFAPPATGPVGSVRMATYNIEFGYDLPGILNGIQGNPDLNASDVFLLQELENYPSEKESKAKTLARDLSMDYVYAPARKVDFGGTHGVGVLSRYPITDVEVVPLPRFWVMFIIQDRIGLGATINPPGRKPIRVYTTHFDTMLSPGQRRKQMAPLVAKANSHAIQDVVLTGDLNTNPIRWIFGFFPIFASWRHDEDMGDFMRSHQYNTPIASLGHTHWTFWRLDHVFTKNLTFLDGKIERSVKASDHYPIWFDVD